MPKQVVIFIAPPGAGKGTQADLLAGAKGFFHLESSKVIEDKFSSAAADDVVIQEEIKKNRSGILNEPKLVSEWMKERIKQLADQDTSIVFSGSPRTLFEAEQLVPFLAELYGKDHIKIFNINISDEESIRRNSARRMCKANRHPIPNLPEFQNITVCPQDGSELMHREDDQPERIRVRHQEYKNRTAPVLVYLHDHGYEIIQISGEQDIKKVSDDILQNFKTN
ncbi:MAG: nucleoside monophosphate kinase [Patescibacteria group bacterium]